MTKTRPITNTASQDDAACPVAKLATEAAEILRIGKSLGVRTMFDTESEPEFAINGDTHPIIRQLRAINSAPDFTLECVCAGLMDALNRHLSAAKAFVPKSLKGALFHLYLAGHITEMGYVDERKRANANRDPDLVIEVELQITRLLHMSIDALEAQLPMGPDPDLVVLKRYLFDPSYQRHVLLAQVLELAKAA